jgi:hypothetical protein
LSWARSNIHHELERGASTNTQLAIEHQLESSRRATSSCQLGMERFWPNGGAWSVLQLGFYHRRMRVLNVNSILASKHDFGAICAGWPYTSRRHERERTGGIFGFVSSGYRTRSNKIAISESITAFGGWVSRDWRTGVAVAANLDGGSRIDWFRMVILW